MDTILTLFEAQALKRPLDIAAIYDSKTLTYQELNEKANQLAHYLYEIGVKPDQTVAICMERSFELLVAILAILKAGGAYTPLDSSHPEDRLLFILDDNKMPILIMDSSLKQKFINYQGKKIILDEELEQISKHPSDNLKTLINPENLAYIIYTSGSTGIPKGVLIEHKSVVNYCHWFAEYSDCKPQQNIDFSSNYIFDMTVSTSLVPLMLGLTIVICSDQIKKDARLYLEYLSLNQVNIIKITPSYFKVLLYEIKNHVADLPEPFMVVLGGENLPAADCVVWFNHYPNHVLFNEYGPTETTVAVSQYKIAKHQLSSLGLNVPIGKPGSNMECSIWRADNTPAEVGEAGELYIGGICLARGYLNQPELTRQKFINSPFNAQRLYKSGDLCRQHADGTIEYLGRIDHQIKIRGFRIEPAEIEKCLIRHAAIREAIVLGQVDRQHEKRLIAYYIIHEQTLIPTAKELRDYLKTLLPEYMIPVAFVRVDNFPLNENGKLDRFALPVPQFAIHQHYLAPTTDLEKKLAEIWSEELGIKLIGVNDNFFELGGHSLSAARIVSKINKMLGKNISLYDFYQHPELRKLAATAAHKIDKINGSNPSSYKNLYATKTLLPLSDWQLLIWLSNTFEPKVKKLNIVGRKRIKGQLNKAALNYALQALMKKQEVLNYRVSKFRPAQIYQHDLHFNLEEIDLLSLSLEESELVLNKYSDELTYHSYWPNSQVKIIAKVFYLTNNFTEIQFCMPHIISDDVSFKILFDDLSKFYLQYESQTFDEIKTNQHYRDYLSEEQNYTKTYLKRDLAFWLNYLSDASLFIFPPEVVINDMDAQAIPYSTYVEIPEKSLSSLQQVCAKHQVSTNDGLYAALALALTKCCNNFHDKNERIFMNIIKSTRDNHKYDETIGCFLRIEPIKIRFSPGLTIISLAKQIHQSIIETIPYQRCSSLVKLASISTLHKKKKRITRFLMNTLAYLYTFLFPKPKLERKIISICGWLTSIERKNKFAITVNIRSNFIPSHEKNSDHFLGFKNQPIRPNFHDVLKIENVFDVCFLRDDSQQTPYLVISGNLMPAFRKKIAIELIKILNSEIICPQELCLKEK